MPDQWRPVPPELDIPGSVYESRVGVTGAGAAPPALRSFEATYALDPGYTYFADVSQYQGVPVDDSYRHPVLSFRICDGAYFDKVCQQNWAAASRMLADPTHPLSLVWVYFGYRPGAWDSVASYIHRVFGSDRFPDRVATMIDAEPWNGEVSGNHSAELNQWAANLAGRTVTGQASVVGYSYTSAFEELWPQMAAWIKRHTASYSTWDPSPYGWQYSGGTGTGGLPGWPHGAGPWPVCDMNVIKRPFTTVLADFGFGEEDMPTADEIAAAVWARVLNGVSAGTRLVNTSNDAANVKEKINNVILDPLHPQSLPGILGQVDTVEESLAALKLQVSAVPTVDQIADEIMARLGSAGPGGLTRQDLINVLNSTRLLANNPTVTEEG